MSAATSCPCGHPLTKHIGAKPCVFGSRTRYTALHQLPIYARMAAADATQANR